MDMDTTKENKPTIVPILDITTIKNLALKVRHDSYSASFDDLKQKEEYVKFAETFPTLFKACCDAKFSLKYLDFMLNNMNNMIESKVTETKATEDVHALLKKDYIDPLIKAQKEEDGKCI